MKKEQQREELKALLSKIQEHLDSSETLSGIKIAGLHLQAEADGERTCCCNGTTIRIPDWIDCPGGCVDGDC